MNVINFEYNRKIINNKNSAFKQQKLPAWQPMLTVDTVLPFFILLGLLFIPIGSVLLVTSQKVQEIERNYTSCESRSHPNLNCDQVIKYNRNEPCICDFKFELRENFRKNVYFYYGLTNYFQNHRRYVKSRDDDQLHGDLSKAPSSDCLPFDRAIDPRTNKTMPIVPCGAIANSLFSDKFRLFYIEKNQSVEVKLSDEGISWPTDRYIKFRNPEDPDLWARFTRPPLWKEHMVNMKDRMRNEHFIVWMRTAALPNFKKLWASVNHSDIFLDGLPKGAYRLEITYAYSVTQFKGTKRFIISNTSWMGGKNAFLGISYIVTGVLCLLLAAFFFALNKKYKKSDSELIQLTIKTPYLPQK
ncbi:Cell cycle control protein 50A-like protein [Dinothrombium tinctorium]|uniref:Cell cycle control protein 50A-like protein n=1 Tax=Dinothrombium tinctorium TaxID=1965070 RepID=A0A3S3PB10_9ACAR|nr:Cell cycle control protein 50A-like protein [Dinothrombium tinctorium]